MSLAALGITWASRVTIQRSGGSDQPWPTLVRTPTGLTHLSMAGAATARAIGPKTPADAVPSVRPALARNSRRRIGSGPSGEEKPEEGPRLRGGSACTPEALLWS